MAHKQKDITAAAVVAQLLGITVSASANAFQVSETITKELSNAISGQENKKEDKFFYDFVVSLVDARLKALLEEVETLKAANSLLRQKHSEAIAQISNLVHQAKSLGIGLTLGMTSQLISPSEDSANCTQTTPESPKESSQWASKQPRRTSRQAEQGEAA